MANSRATVILWATGILFFLGVIVALWGIALFDYRVAMIVGGVGAALLALSIDG